MNTSLSLLQVIHIPQSSSITGSLPSERLVSYPGYSGGGLTPLQRCSLCIFPHYPTEPQGTRWELYPSAEMQLVHFSSQANWATGHWLGESYSSAEMQLLYFSSEANWATGHSLGESYSSAEMQLLYFSSQANWATERSLGESYSSADMSLVYFSSIANWSNN